MGDHKLTLIEESELEHLVAENARLKELNREMYKALLNILHLKAADELDEELWTKAWAIGVDAIRAANGEKAENGGEGECLKPCNK